MLDILKIIFPIIFVLIVTFLLICYILKVRLDETSKGDLIIYYSWKGKRKSKIFLRNDF